MEGGGVLGECCSTYHCLMGSSGTVTMSLLGGEIMRGEGIRSGKARVVFNRLQRNGGSKCLCDGLTSDLISITRVLESGWEGRKDLGMHHSRSRYWSAAAGTLPPWWRRTRGGRGLMCDAWFCCCHLHGPDGTGAHIGYA